MASISHNTVSCFTLDFSGNRQSEVIKFDKDFKFLNVTIRRDGWIKWDYDSSNLENYNFKFKIAMAGLAGGGSINLNFWLEEVIPTAEIPVNGYPVEYVTEFKEDTYESIRHIANRNTVLGGLMYQLDMKLEQQYVQMPRINEQRTRWYRLRIATRAPLSCSASDAQLNGFRIPIENSENGLLPGNEYSTFHLPFISLYVEKASTSLLDTDLTSMQIVTFDDLQEFRGDLVEDINVENTDINSAITTLVGDTEAGVTIEEVREALIEDLSDNTSDFSEAVLDLVNGSKDFIINPDTANVNPGATFEFDINLFNNLDINTIQAISSDITKATVSINTTNKKIIVMGVATGSTNITVSSTAISKTQDLTITINEPSEATFKATNISGDLISYKMWASLDTTTNELTLASPNGSNIILAGWVVGIDTVAKTAVIRYLKANPANYQLNLAPGYTVAQGDPVILADGIGKATGYTVPNCTYSGTNGYVRVAITASDIAILEQHKVI